MKTSYLKCGPGPAGAALPGSVQQRGGLRPHIGPTESEGAFQQDALL